MKEQRSFLAALAAITMAAAPIAAAAVPIAKAGARPIKETRIAKRLDDGSAVSISTGTEDGLCRAEGSLIVCRDGASFAEADLTLGCLSVSGGGSCTLELGQGESPSAAESPTLAATPEESHLDIRCDS